MEKLFEQKIREAAKRANRQIDSLEVIEVKEKNGWLVGSARINGSLVMQASSIE